MASAPEVATARVGGGQPRQPPALWVRMLASLPMSVLHGAATVLAWVNGHLWPHRAEVVMDHLRHAFPDKDEQQLCALRNEFYASYADVLVEIIKSAAMSGEELDQRMQFSNLELMQRCLREGTPVVLLAAHQCNWEWILLGLSRQLGFPVDAAYKPLRNAWADEVMRSIRSRFGARMIAAPRLLRDMLGRRRLPRLIALVADQEPVASDRRHWTQFLNRDSAFFMGADVIAQTLHYPTFFVAIERVGRGQYLASFEPLWMPGEPLQAGDLAERYARRVEQQIHASPADWPWSHKRWRLQPDEASTEVTI